MSLGVMAAVIVALVGLSVNCTKIPQTKIIVQNAKTECQKGVIRMTDNEIINALEYIRYHLTASKHKEVIDDAIDLINRQQAEIERLKKLLEEADISYNKCAKRFYKDDVKDFAKMLIDKSENGAVSISDLPDLVREWSDNNAE